MPRVYLGGLPRGELLGEAQLPKAAFGGGAVRPGPLWGHEVVFRRDDQASGGWMRRGPVCDEACLGVKRTTPQSSRLSSMLQR